MKWIGCNHTVQFLSIFIYKYRLIPLNSMKECHIHNTSIKSSGWMAYNLRTHELTILKWQQRWFQNKEWKKKWEKNAFGYSHWSVVNAQCTAPVIVTVRTDKKSDHTLVTCAVYINVYYESTHDFKERYLDFQTVNVMIKVNISDRWNTCFMHNNTLYLIRIDIDRDRRWHFPNMVHTTETYIPEINLNVGECEQWAT